MTFDMGNGFTIGVYCAARPGNTLESWSSSFDPSNSNSPITVTRTPFSWEKLVAYNFIFVKNDVGLGFVGGGGGIPETDAIFKSLGTAWKPFSPDHWTDSPEAQRAAQQRAETEAAQDARIELDRSKEAAEEAQKRQEMLAAKAFSQFSGVVSGPELISVFTNRVVTPLGTLADMGKLQTSEKMTPVITVFYPDGHKTLRIEAPLSFLHPEVVTHTEFGPGLQFKISRLELQKDNIEFHLTNTAEPMGTATARIMLGKSWQTTMSTRQLIREVSKAFTVQW